MSGAFQKVSREQALNLFDPLLNLADVCKILSCKPRYVYYARERGRFPEPVKIGRANRWRPSDIQAFIDASGESDCAGQCQVASHE